jgi:hypothetical protein
MRNAVLFLLVAIPLLSGCDKAHDSAAPVAPKPTLKPLPACEEQVAAELQTAETPLARKREIQIGYRENTYFVKFALDQGETRPNLKLDRDTTYFVTVATTKLDGSMDYQSRNFYVPTCDKRQDFQNANTSYEEPIKLVTQ